MGKNVSVLGRIKSYLGLYFDTAVADIKGDESLVVYDKPSIDIGYDEFGRYEHYCIRKYNLPIDEIFIPEGYEVVAYVDESGWRYENTEGYVGEIYVEFANVVPVLANDLRRKTPYGFNGYVEFGKPLNKEVGTFRR